MFETIDNVLVVNQDPGIADTCLAGRVMTAVGRARTVSRLLPATPDAPVVDRRTSVRHGRTLLNLSRGGLQAVSDSRLLPGTAQEVTLRARDDSRWTLRALVLRCQVSPVDAGRVRFLTALSFLEPCSWSPAEATPTR